MIRSLVIVAILAGAAAAQSPTTGAIQGVVIDAKTHEPLPGVTIIVSSSGSSAQTAITDAHGAYKIADLAPGDYLVTFYYLDGRLERSDIHVGVQRVTPLFQSLDPGNGGEVVQVHGRPPAINPTSTTQGMTVDQEALKNLPVPGRSFEGALVAAPGAQLDSNLIGIAFSGSTSEENQYYIDGVNTTNVSYGTVGSPVINDFIQEIEVISGGYNAEYGRATGAIVNVVTKSGSNKLAGSVFGTWQPGMLAAASKHAPVNASSLAVTQNNGYVADVGFELGGPIIKDKLWFFVGFSPQASRTDFTRTVQRETDCHGVMPDGSVSDCDPRVIAFGGHADGTPDVDPHTGLFITEPVGSEVRSSDYRRYDALGKINYAASADQQGQLALEIAPSSSREPGLYGVATAGRKTSELTTDLSAKWTSKLRDGRTELEAIVGWHRDAFDADGFDASLQDTPAQTLYNASIGALAPGFGESAKIGAGCADSVDPTADAYPYITNCPVGGYTVGGPGSLYRNRGDRRSARLGITQRIAAAGNHELKAGIDVEDNTTITTRAFSGGAYIGNAIGNEVDVQRWIAVTDLADTRDRFDHICGTQPITNPFGIAQYKCDFLDKLGDPGTLVDGETLNWSAYLRDSWQLQPNLTINAGLRYEEQHARFASFLQGVVDPLTGMPRGKDAASLKGLIALRVGVLYDWTKVGRSKLYAHWGRFYESIPLAVNDAGAADPITYVQAFNAATCGATDPRLGGPDGIGCTTGDQHGDRYERINGVVGKLVEPGLRGQYLDEVVGGVELELIDDLKLGLSFQKRWLGSVIEDVSTNGGRIFILANPGEWSAAEEDKLDRQIAATSDPAAKQRLQTQLEAFKGIRNFDRPQRDYSAVQLTAVRRFSKRFYLQAAYTYARTTGDYVGVAPETGGTPNLSSQYDFVELDANRLGPLPLDRPHYLKVSGYYTFDLHRAGIVTLGVAFRAQSGAPESVLGPHWIYGGNVAFLLPRGAVGRTDFEHGLDVHLGYGRDLPHGMKAEVFADVFGIYNNQGTFAVDGTYANTFAVGTGIRQSANPVSGGSYDDLIWLKALDNMGGETSTPISRNPNFKQVSVYYSPVFARLGARLTF